MRTRKVQKLQSALLPEASFHFQEINGQLAKILDNFNFNTVLSLLFGSGQTKQIIFQYFQMNVIIAIGVWEINKPQFCSQNSPNTTVQQRVDSTIENIFKNNPKNLKVAIRTSGFDERFQNKDKIIFDINSIEREKFMGKNTDDVCLVD